MEAVRKLDNRANDSRYNPHEPGNVIQMAPYYNRRGMRAPFDNNPLRSFESTPRGNRESADLVATFARILSAITLPELVAEFVKILDEKIRSQKAATAFEKADAAFEEMRNTNYECPKIMRRTTGIIRRRKIKVQGYYKQEETRRIYSLTGQIDGNIENVLIWET